MVILSALNILYYTIFCSYTCTKGSDNIPDYLHTSTTLLYENPGFYSSLDIPIIYRAVKNVKHIWIMSIQKSWSVPGRFLKLGNGYLFFVCEWKVHIVDIHWQTIFSQEPFFETQCVALNAPTTHPQPHCFTADSGI